MKYSLEDIAAVSAVAKAVNEVGFKKLPPAIQGKIQSKISADEMSELMAGMMELLQAEMAVLLGGDRTVKPYMQYLKFNETVIGYTERTLSQPEIVKMYNVEDLEAKHVVMCRELGFPKMAQIVEDGLSLLAAKPKKPEFRIGQASFPENSRR